MEHLKKLWEAAIAQEYGVGIKTDNRELLRAQLYRTRVEMNDERFGLMVILMPEGTNEIWIVHKDADERVK